MKSTVEPLEGNKVKVSVEVDAEEFEKAIDAAFRTLAKQVNIRGFRRGKVPRRILEAQFGGDMARQQALQDALPEYYAQAVRDNEVDVIAPPEIDITVGAEQGPVGFDAVVEVRPSVTITGYAELEVSIPRPETTEEDVDDRIDQMRGQHGEFAAADRAAADGDQVLVDIAGSQNGEPIEGLTAEDYQYEVGSGTVVAEIDENLRGAKAGDVITFTAAHPEEGEDELSFTLTVKEVRGSVLPEVTDAWVAEVSEHASVDALRSEIKRQISRQRLVAANQALHERSAEALANLVTDEVPEAMIDSEVSARVQNLAGRLRQQKIELGRFLELTGQSPKDLVAQYREPATQAIRMDLALRAVGEQEAIEVSDEDLDKFFDSQAQQFSQPTSDIRDAYQRAGQMSAVRSEIKKSKALEWVLEHVNIVDEDGSLVDRGALVFPSDLAGEHDHDHDHHNDHDETPVRTGEE